MERKLVTVREVLEVNEHPNADALELLTIDGWQVVAKLGEFKQGDKCVYFEIDSFLPADDPRYEFLIRTGTKKAPDGKDRIRLKTIKLRKELSQGLALPIDQFPEVNGLETLEDDLSEVLDVIKYERPEPKTANASGNFPSFIPKTNEDRIQNCWGRLKRNNELTPFWPTLKMDGSSCTVFYTGMIMSKHWKGDTLDVTREVHGEEENTKIGEIGVCSRNLQLKYDEDSHFWKAAFSSGVIDALKEHSQNIAIQGEVMGPGIQGNKENFVNYRFFVFGIYDINFGEYLTWDEVMDFCHTYNLETVLTMSDEPIQVFIEFESVKDILEYSDGPSINAKLREGIVWKSKDDGGLSFKAISNKWLMKTGD